MYPSVPSEHVNVFIAKTQTNQCLSKHSPKTSTPNKTHRRGRADAAQLLIFFDLRRPKSIPTWRALTNGALNKEKSETKYPKHNEVSIPC